MLSETLLREWLEGVLGEEIVSMARVSGGDINEARHVDCASGRYFVKFSSRSTAFDNLSAERDGLELIQSTSTIRVPAVNAVGKIGSGAALLMEYIEPERSTRESWTLLGRQLAALHRTTNDRYGLGRSNYIGALPQPNDWRESWVDFYVSQRLEPQWRSASEYFSSSDHRAWDGLLSSLPEILHEEPPALIHGDLWSGNFMFDALGPVLIDPSVAYAHREMDIAMSRLFGGFDQAFYDAYHEEFPLHPGVEERIPLYQLYYLLVHVNLFGAGYVTGVRGIINNYNS